MYSRQLAELQNLSDSMILKFGYYPILVPNHMVPVARHATY